MPFLASPWKSIGLINDDFKCWGNSLRVGIAGSLTNGDVKELDTMEDVDEAMINLDTQHSGGFEDGAYLTYGNPSHYVDQILCVLVTPRY